MDIFTYSFEDVTVNISHPQVGNYSAYGTGIGTVSVSYENPVTYHDVSSDGAVVVSKAVRKNGTITFSVLQSSDFNSFLKKWSNYLETSHVSNFALTTITITNRSTGDVYYCSGCSHQKKADNEFASQAGNRTWTIMAAKIVEG